MKPFVERWGTSVAIAAILGGELASILFAGWRGFVGMSLGLGATSFNCWALWLLIGYMGRSIQGTGSSKGYTALVIIAFLIKLPLLIGLGFLTRLLGLPALTCFVSGLGMVYFGLVGWGLVRS